jgi:CheY-like chemotaxis protein/PAS domain-containing protein
MTPNSPLDHGVSLSNIDENRQMALRHFSRFETLISKSNDICFIVDAIDKKFTYVNEAVNALLGFSREEAQALIPNALMTAASMETLCDAIPRSIAASSRHESTIQVPPLHIQLIAKDRKRIPAVIYCAITLTPEHTAESISGIVKHELLYRTAGGEGGGGNDRLLQEVFDTLPMGCIVSAPIPEGDDFIIQHCNAAALRMEDLNADECIGKRISEILPDLKKNDIYTLIESVAESGIAVRLPDTFYATAKGDGWREYFISRLSSGSIMLLFSNETGRKQQAALSTELVESFGVPAGGVAHDKHSVGPSGLSPVQNTGQGRVLIMDDEEILLDIATQMCRRLGLEVVTTANSMNAVEVYREEFRQGRPFDLVMLDLTIPGGSGGLETVATLRKIDPEIKAVAMSGYADHEVMADPAKFGFTAILTKPFRLNEFGTVLRTILPPEKFQVKQ